MKITLEKRTTTPTPQRWTDLTAAEAFEIIAQHETDLNEDQEAAIKSELAENKLTWGDFRAYPQ